MFENLRIGTGFDVHELVADRDLILGGVKIAHEKGLLGHSDADALIHAVVDSILGALGAGDIGKFFPPSDPKWKNASSRDFLKFAGQQVKERGAQIISIDSCLMLERPKIAPHIESMRRNMAEDLGVSFDRVHVKATTTEKLGFTGREEGVAAQAVCLIEYLKAPPQTAK